MAQRQDLVISIVNYNTRDLLDQCLDSIYSLGLSHSFEICVVDNNSTDGSQEMVRSKYSRVSLICNNDNPGFGRANNQVIANADSRYMLILNPDIIVKPGSIENVIAFMDKNADVGITGCKLLNPDNSIQYSCRRFPVASTILLRGLGADFFASNASYLKSYLMSDWDHETLSDVDWVMGSCMFLRMDALKHTGLFDEKFFMYYEDVDLCIRMWNKYRVCYFPDSNMIHYHLKHSHKLTSLSQRFIHIKSAYRFFKKHGINPVRELLSVDNKQYKARKVL